jgi:hypothetical protein
MNPATLVRARVGRLAPAIIIILHASCLNLDPFLFRGIERTEYLFDDYAGKAECPEVLDSLDLIGAVADSQIVEYRLLSGGDSISAVLLAASPRSPLDTLIVYFHGWTGNIDYYWPRTRLLHATGFPVLIVDYKGYGCSSGASTVEGLYQDGRAALELARDSLGDPQLVVYGYSLGAMAACEAAADPRGSRIVSLVLESPIGKLQTGLQDVWYLDMPSSYVTTFEIDNVEKIARVSVPLLWMHGTHDEALARETNGLPVWENYGGIRKYGIEVRGGRHSNLPPVIGYRDYVRCVRSFARAIPDSSDLLDENKIAVVR